MQLKKTLIATSLLLAGLSSLTHAEVRYEYRKPLGVRVTPMEAIGFLDGSGSFNTLAFGTKQEQSFRFENKGTAASTAVIAYAQGAGFTLIENTCGSVGAPGTLAPGNVCNLRVEYSPTKPGVQAGTLTVSSSAKNGPATAQLAGAGNGGVGQLTPVTNSAFGTVYVGQSATKSFTYQNKGSFTDPAVSASVSGNGFTITSSTCGTPSAAISLAAGASCSITVKYAPLATGDVEGGLFVTSSANGSPYSQQLTGTGINVPTNSDIVLEPASGSSAYASVAVGTSATRTFALINRGSTAVNGLPAPLVRGNAFYSLTGTTCTSSLAAKASCTVTVKYLPTAQDTSTASIEVGNVSSALSGTTGETLVHGRVGENQVLTLTAPAGKTFGPVVFASYGTATGGTNGQYVMSSCHSRTSETVVTAAFAGKSTGSVAATNANFGDPCVNVVKSLAVAIRVQ